ncbi:unnamed protein product [Phytophthora fragariaefolia]|uniref:Unnamed protein product n=1 Tax=Phytophthora fragariaefolia TaxID=1490495 RepID=A0A9W6WUB4_9STRA|nr:unnamed protein product [Phytophthora fragariaefolia]
MLNDATVRAQTPIPRKDVIIDSMAEVASSQDPKQHPQQTYGYLARWSLIMPEHVAHMVMLLKDSCLLTLFDLVDELQVQIRVEGASQICDLERILSAFTLALRTSRTCRLDRKYVLKVIICMNYNGWGAKRGYTQIRSRLHSVLDNTSFDAHYNKLRRLRCVGRHDQPGVSRRVDARLRTCTGRGSVVQQRVRGGRILARWVGVGDGSVAQRRRRHAYVPSSAQ